jgi:hypothetical protein
LLPAQAEARVHGQQSSGGAAAEFPASCLHQNPGP